MCILSVSAFSSLVCISAAESYICASFCPLSLFFLFDCASFCPLSLFLLFEWTLLSFHTPCCSLYIGQFLIVDCNMSVMSSELGMCHLFQDCVWYSSYIHRQRGVMKIVDIDSTVPYLLLSSMRLL